MPSTRDRRWVLLIPAVVLVLGGLTAWWIVSPDAFPDGPGNAVGVETASVGEPVVFGAAARPETDVTLASARPRLEGDATVRVAVCDRPIGVVDGPLEDVCADASEVEGALLGPELERWLVVEVTPTSDDVSVIQGLSVAYTQGLRFGRQITGPVITVGGAAP